MYRRAAALPFTSRFGFRDDDREVERLEVRRLRVPADRRFERFEPFRFRRPRPPASEANKRPICCGSITHLRAPTALPLVVLA